MVFWPFVHCDLSAVSIKQKYLRWLFSNVGSAAAECLEMAACFGFA
jgi:hypothetical protein